MLQAHHQLGATQDTKLGQPRVSSYTSEKPGATRKKSTNTTKEAAFSRVKSKGRPEEQKEQKVVVDGEQPDRMAWPPSLYFFSCLLYFGVAELHKKQGILKRRELHKNIFLYSL